MKKDSRNTKETTRRSFLASAAAFSAFAMVPPPVVAASGQPTLGGDEMAAALNIADVKLNHVYHELLKRLSHVQRLLLREAQRRWVGFRDNTVETDIAGFPVPQESYSAVIQEKTRLTDERVKHLESFVAIEKMASDIPWSDIVLVSSSEGLLESVQTGRSILLLPGAYYFEGSQPGQDNAPESLTHLDNLEDLHIIGVSPEKVSFNIGQESQGSILVQNCRNITLRNISFGNNPTNADAPLLHFTGCSNIELDNCKFAKAQKALAFSGCSEMRVRRCAFLECSKVIADVLKSQDVFIYDTVFNNNGGLFVFNNSTVTIDNGRFFHDIAHPLFGIDETSSVYLNTTLLPILDPVLLTNAPDSLHMNGCLDDESPWVVQDGEYIVESQTTMDEEEPVKVEYYEVDPYLNIRAVVETTEEGIRAGGSGGIHQTLYRLTSQKKIVLGDLFGLATSLIDKRSRVVMSSVARAGAGRYIVSDGYVFKDRTQPYRWFEFSPYEWDLLYRSQIENNVSDKRLNLLYAYAKKYLGDPLFSSIRKAQRSWLAYRDADARFVQNLYADPLEATEAKLNRYVALTNERNDYLSKIICGTPIPEHAGGQKIIEVSTVEALLESIGPNRKIILGPGEYKLGYTTQKRPDNPFIEGNIMDTLHVQGVQNMTLAGALPGEVAVITGNAEVPVLAFSDCQNIQLINITAGHEPPGMSYCGGAVIELTDCEQVYVKKSDFYGCGLIGIVINDVNKFVCVDTILRDCSSYGLLINNAADISFLRTHFRGNNGGACGLGAGMNTSIQFFDCVFINNTSSTGTEDSAECGEIVQIVSGAEPGEAPSFTACTFVVNSPECESASDAFLAVDCIFEKAPPDIPMIKAIPAVKTKTTYGQ